MTHRFGSNYVLSSVLICVVLAMLISGALFAALWRSGGMTRTCGDVFKAARTALPHGAVFEKCPKVALPRHLA